jgi:ArsR family transcriptional regulator, lead/cadmium/zinc/bismuth-responsive transcriptional repressor
VWAVLTDADYSPCLNICSYVGAVVAEPIADLDACTVRMVDPGKVATVRVALPAPGDIDDLAAVFGLLGDPSRLRLLAALLEGGELCVCDLAAAAGMSESAVSHALRLLRAHRVVTVTRRGRMAYYRLDDAHVRMLLDLGLAHTQHATSTRPTSAGRTS